MNQAEIWPELCLTAAAWLRQGKLYDRVYFILFVFKVAQTGNCQKTILPTAVRL